LAVLDAIVACGCLAAFISADTRCAILADATARIEFTWVAGLPAAVGVGLMAVLDIVITSRGVFAAPVLGVAEDTAAVVCHLARIAIGAALAVAAAVEIGLASVSDAIITGGGSTPFVGAYSGRTIRSLATDGAIGARRTVSATVSIGLSTILNAVVTDARLTDLATRNIFAHSTATIRGQGTALSVTARSTLITATIGVGFAAVGDAVVTPWGSADIGDTVCAGTIGGSNTVLARRTWGTCASTIGVGLVTIAATVVASRFGSTDAIEGVAEVACAVGSDITGGPVRAAIAVATAVCTGFSAVLNIVIACRCLAELTHTDPVRTIFTTVTRLAKTARSTLITATIDVCLVTVCRVVITVGGGTPTAPRIANTADAVCGQIAFQSVSAGGTKSAAVHVCFTAVLDVVFAAKGLGTATITAFVAFTVGIFAANESTAACCAIVATAVSVGFVSISYPVVACDALAASVLAHEAQTVGVLTAGTTFGTRVAGIASTIFI